MQYKLTRTCKDCKNEDSFSLTKVEAAFELYDSSVIWNTPCSNCDSVNCESLGHHHPKLDKELLDLWGNDSELYLMEQDEELFLAELEYLPMILESIDEGRYPSRKTNVLIESICVLLYDNTASRYEYSKEENEERENIAKKVRPELVKRIDRIKNAEAIIMDYIKDVVFPQIGL